MHGIKVRDDVIRDWKNNNHAQYDLYCTVVDGIVEQYKKSKMSMIYEEALAKDDDNDNDNDDGKEVSSTLDPSPHPIVSPTLCPRNSLRKQILSPS